jgi:hypothetical protein
MSEQDTTAVVIELEDGVTHPMTPPAELGEAFAAVIATALSLSPADRVEIEQKQIDSIPDGEDAYWRLTDEIHETLEDAGLAWSCQFGEPDHPAEAGPYIDTLRDHDMTGASYVAAAVLARDLGLIVEADFAAVTAWWVAAGLPLPPPSTVTGAGFAADAAQVKQNAADLSSNRYRMAGWPKSAVR